MRQLSGKSKLAQLRVTKGLSQSQLANKLGVTWKDVQRWELGQNDLRARYCRPYAKAVGVSTDYLLKAIEEMI